MVVRKGLSSLILPLLLHAMAFGCAGYFIFHAHYGQRGLETKKVLKQQRLVLTQELEALKRESKAWQQRLALMQVQSLDRDLLEERARHVLNRVHANDLVIMTGEPAKP
jgi:cell division protein FtsB